MAERLTRETLFEDIAEGMDVLSSDGARLGAVKCIEADRFAVDVRLARDYWLTGESVLFVDIPENRVVMDFHKSEEKNFRVDPPVQA